MKTTLAFLFLSTILFAAQKDGAYQYQLCEIDYCKNSGLTAKECPKSDVIHQQVSGEELPAAQKEYPHLESKCVPSVIKNVNPPEQQFGIQKPRNK